MMFYEPYPPSQAADGVWVGGRPSAATLGALKAAGVTHVLNVSTDPHGSEVRRDFRATWVPVVDDLEPKPASWFRRGLSFARRALDDPSCQLYVHCREGVHRGPLMTYVILRALRGLSPAEAKRAITGKRPVASFPRVYLESAEAFLQQEPRQDDSAA